MINKLYDKNNKIYLYIGRHMQKEEMTKKWLEKYGVKYHHVFFGKPVADVYIDDKSISSKEFLNNETLIELIAKRKVKI